MSKPPRWRRDLTRAFHQPAELLRHLGLDASALPAPLATAVGFPLLVPRGFAARMRVGEPDDPLLRQVIPLAIEQYPAPGFVRDPVGDAAARHGAALLRKYPGRALILATSACAIHCRYCFRRHFAYARQPSGRDAIWAAIAEIAADQSIQEVILSGGDPLLLDNATLADLLDALVTIPHLQRLRVHTRVPVVLPTRIDTGLSRLLATSRLPVVIVIQVNHAQELDESAYHALSRLRHSGAQLLNQAVLLRGINDETAALAHLSEALFGGGVLPYYLHLLDRVQGAQHFEVTTARALALMADLRDRLPGYLVPRLVREERGRMAKSPVG